MTSTGSSAAASFRSRVAEFSARIDAALIARIDAIGAATPLRDGMRYAMGLDIEDPVARGKRIRPVLCLATAEDFGVAVDRALAFALGIELLHNFALVHDDIEDGDRVRRDRPAVWIAFGQAHGINIGDALLAEVWRLLSTDPTNDAETRLALVTLMAETLAHTIEGQALDIEARRSHTFGRADYDRLVREKTGHYLAAPMLGAAIVAGASDAARAALSAFGHHAGPLFQITDDLLDMTAGKGRGGALGSDIREGKRSFLVAVALERASASDRDRLLDVLDADRDATTDGDVRWAMELFTACGAVEEARRRCAELQHLALAAINTPAIPIALQTTLSAFAGEMASRTR